MWYENMDRRSQRYQSIRRLGPSRNGFKSVRKDSYILYAGLQVGVRSQKYVVVNGKV